MLEYVKQGGQVTAALQNRIIDVCNGFQNPGGNDGFINTQNGCLRHNTNVQSRVGLQSMNPCPLFTVRQSMSFELVDKEIFAYDFNVPLLTYKLKVEKDANTLKKQFILDSGEKPLSGIGVINENQTRSFMFTDALLSGMVREDGFIDTQISGDALRCVLLRTATSAESDIHENYVCFTSISNDATIAQTASSIFHASNLSAVKSFDLATRSAPLSGYVVPGNRILDFKTTDVLCDSAISGSNLSSTAVNTLGGLQIFGFQGSSLSGNIQDGACNFLFNDDKFGNLENYYSADGTKPEDFIFPVSMVKRFKSLSQFGSDDEKQCSPCVKVTETGDDNKGDYTDFPALSVQLPPRILHDSEKQDDNKSLETRINRGMGKNPAVARTNQLYHFDKDDKAELNVNLQYGGSTTVDTDSAFLLKHFNSDGTKTLQYKQLTFTLPELPEPPVPPEPKDYDEEIAALSGWLSSLDGYTKGLDNKFWHLDGDVEKCHGQNIEVAGKIYSEDGSYNIDVGSGILEGDLWQASDFEVDGMIAQTGDIKKLSCEDAKIENLELTKVSCDVLEAKTSIKTPTVETATITSPRNAVNINCGIVTPDEVSCMGVNAGYGKIHTQGEIEGTYFTIPATGNLVIGNTILDEEKLIALLKLIQN